MYNQSITMNKDLVETSRLYLYGEITQQSAYNTILDLRNKETELMKLSLTHDVDFFITLEIQSEGGSILPAWSVVETIKLLKIPVRSVVNGYAASAATLISMCCDKRFITESSYMLIHQLWGGMFGKHQELQDDMSFKNMLQIQMKRFYKQNSKLKSKKIDELMSRDSWLNSQTCLEYGFVDKIL